MNTIARRVALLYVLSGAILPAQTVDDTPLKQVIILGRHSVRSPLAPASVMNTFAVRPFPDFGVPPGNLTANGGKLETILAGYYRLWLTQEGLLTGNDAAGANLVYFRANTLQRTVATAQAFAAGLLPRSPSGHGTYAASRNPRE